MAGIKSVAKHANVSISTVSKYMSGKNVLPELAERVKKAVEELDYQPNPMAKGLKNTITSSFGIIISTPEDVYSVDIAARISRILAQKNYGLLLSDCDGNVDNFEKVAKFFNSKLIDGVFIFPEGISKDKFKGFLDRKIPIIALDSPIAGLETDFISSDNFQIGYDCGMALIKNGHKRVAALCSFGGIVTSDLRYEGFKKAYEDSGIGTDGIFKIPDCVDDSPMFGELLELYDKQHITAAFSVNYYITLKYYVELWQRPEIINKLSFISVDGMNISKLTGSRLTHIEQDHEKIAEEAANLMMKRAKKLSPADDAPVEFQTIYVPAKIFTGQSIAKLDD